MLAVAVVLSSFAAPRPKAAAVSVRPLAVSAETQKKMAKYSLAAYENGDATNRVKALLFTPKPMGTSALPMVVYIPGNGELGEVGRHFRQPAILDRVTSRAF